MLIILITILLCLARNLVPELAALLDAIETEAAILALSVYTFIIFRVWSVARVAPARAASQ